MCDAIYQNRKDSGKIIVKFTGKNFLTERNGTAKCCKTSKVVVEKLYTDDYKYLSQYGAEKDLEQVEGESRKFLALLDCGIIDIT